MNPEQRWLIVSTAEVHYTPRSNCARTVAVHQQSQSSWAPWLTLPAFDIEHTLYSEYCNTSASPMNQSDSDRIQEVCSQIAVEQDRQKFLKLVQELNRLLSAKDGRLQDNETIARRDE
jgi:hypothetical protein